MFGLVEKSIGIYHFLTDRAPKHIPLVDPKPLTVNHWCRNGQVVVAKVKVDGDIGSCVQKTVGLLGDTSLAIQRGDNVLVKPNFNSPDPYPASTDLDFLRAIIEFLVQAGAKVTVGESSGGIWRPTRNVFRKLGLFELARQLDVKLVAFEDKPDDWVRIKVDGDYLKMVTMPRSAYEADKIVYIPCMKTHKLARFSGALKLAMGLIHPGERRAMHASHLEQKVVDINLCWQPDLVVMDGRKAFVSAGPNKGQLAEPGVILASGDMVAIDVEAVKVLLGYKAVNKLTPDPWQLPQIITALKHGLGAGAGSYIVVG